MRDMFRVRLDEAIREVERELDVRRKLYPEWVSRGTMPRLAANAMMGRMEAARDFLLELRLLKGGNYEGRTEQARS